MLESMTERHAAEPAPAQVERHFTVTGFLVHEGRTLLLWHAKNRMWLPPGGHIEPGEEPEGAVLREILEETGIEASIVPTDRQYAFTTPRQVTRPAAILLEEIAEPGRPHQHIDLIYFCRPSGSVTNGHSVAPALWLDESGLREDLPFEYEPGRAEAVPEDVRELGMAAIRHVAGRG